jgi:hypothetical protein
MRALDVLRADADEDRRPGAAGNTVHRAGRCTRGASKPEGLPQVVSELRAFADAATLDGNDQPAGGIAVGDNDAGSAPP